MASINFKFNILTGENAAEKYNAITSKDPFTFYILQTGVGYLGDKKVFDSSTFESTPEEEINNAIGKFFRDVKTYTITEADLTNTSINKPEGIVSGDSGLLFTADNNETTDGDETQYFVPIKVSLPEVPSKTDTIDAENPGNDVPTVTAVVNYVKQAINNKISYEVDSTTPGGSSEETTNTLPIASTVSETDNIVANSQTGNVQIPFNIAAEYFRNYAVSHIIPLDIGAASGFNFLDNAHFINPINQLGKEEYTTGCAIDRWMVANGVPKNKSTISLTNNGIKFTQTAFDSYWSCFIQYLEKNCLPQLGRPVTLSFLYSECTSNVQVQIRKDGNVIKIVDIPSGSGLISTTFNIPESFELLSVGVYLKELNASITLIAAKLESGSKQTLAYQDASKNWIFNNYIDRTLELLKCQKYQLILPGNASNYPVIGFGTTYEIADNTQRVQISIPTPVTMRAKPTITATGQWFLRGGGGIITLNFDNLVVECLQYSFNFVTLDFIITETGSGSILPNMMVELIRNDNLTDQIILDANLR